MNSTLNSEDDRALIMSQLREAMAELFDLEASAVQPQTRLVDDLDIDSIDTIDLLTELRQRTGARIEPVHFREARTVGDVVDVIIKFRA